MKFKTLVCLLYLIDGASTSCKSRRRVDSASNSHSTLPVSCLSGEWALTASKVEPAHYTSPWPGGRDNVIYLPPIPSPSRHALVSPLTSLPQTNSIVSFCCDKYCFVAKPKMADQQILKSTKNENRLPKWSGDNRF